MCINLKTSISAFIIGELSGLYLILNNQKNIGIFVMFYTIIQLIEAFMYYYKNNYKLYSRLLSIFLSLQGLVIILSSNNIESIWFLIFGIISLINIIYTLSDHFKTSEINTCNDCLNWDFLNMNKLISILLAIMYFLIYVWVFTRNIKFYNLFGILLLLTYIFSYYLKNIKNSPSMWCMTSAFAGPIAVILSKII
jgi:hypothetical protein